MRTTVCERLGIEVPIIQAPMGGAVGPSLAAAVSNAGGLGTLALWGADIENLRRQVRETRGLTSKPFAVNLNLEFPQEERLDACLQEGVPIISLFWRDPSNLVARAKSGGATVLHTVSTAKEARHAVRTGDCGVAEFSDHLPSLFRRVITGCSNLVCYRSDVLEVRAKSGVDGDSHTVARSFACSAT